MRNAALYHAPAWRANHGFIAGTILTSYPSLTMPLIRLSLSALIVALCGCGPAASEGGFDSANSAARMYAIEYAARDGDRTAIPKLVEQLNADDEAVRALAIASLQRLTSQTKGYRDYDPIELRRDAVARWVHAVHSGEFDQAAEVSNTEGHGGPQGVNSEGTKHKSQITNDRNGDRSSLLCFVLCAFPISPLSPWPSVALRVSSPLPERHRG